MVTHTQKYVKLGGHICLAYHLNLTTIFFGSLCTCNHLRRMIPKKKKGRSHHRCFSHSESFNFAFHLVSEQTERQKIKKK